MRRSSKRTSLSKLSVKTVSQLVEFKIAIGVVAWPRREASSKSRLWWTRKATVIQHVWTSRQGFYSSLDNNQVVSTRCQDLNVEDATDAAEAHLWSILREVQSPMCLSLTFGSVFCCCLVKSILLLIFMNMSGIDSYFGCGKEQKFLYITCSYMLFGTWILSWVSCSQRRSRQNYIFDVF